MQSRGLCGFLLVELYRHGRVLFAGAAAHIHAPVGGQGLNLGIQDAMNLGWKLAAEVHGLAPGGLLDSYHAERYPVAEGVLANTLAQRVLMGPAPGAEVAALRGIVTDLMRLPEVNRYLSGMMSGLAFGYELPGPAHPLLSNRIPDLDLITVDGQFQLAELLRRGRGLLLAFGDQPALAGVLHRWSARVDHVLAKTADDPGARAVLLRPDGYVAWPPTVLRHRHYRMR